MRNRAGDPAAQTDCAQMTIDHAVATATVRRHQDMTLCQIVIDGDGIEGILNARMAAPQNADKVLARQRAGDHIFHGHPQIGDDEIDLFEFQFILQVIATEWPDIDCSLVDYQTKAGLNLCSVHLLFYGLAGLFFSAGQSQLRTAARICGP